MVDGWNANSTMFTLTVDCAYTAVAPAPSRSKPESATQQSRQFNIGSPPEGLHEIRIGVAIRMPAGGLVRRPADCSRRTALCCQTSWQREGARHDVPAHQVSSRLRRSSASRASNLFHGMTLRVRDPRADIFTPPEGKRL